MEKPKKTVKWKRILALALAVLAVAGVFFGLRYYRRLTQDPASAFATPTPSASPGVAPTPALSAAPMPSPTVSPEEALSALSDRDFMRGRVNILLLGWDQSPEREDAGSALYRDENNNYRSDVLMLCCVDFTAGTVDLISIPRDTMARIYQTTGRWKINAAFAKGGASTGDGFAYAMRTVETLLQVPITQYAGVDMAGVKAVVDALGGVDYDVDVRIELGGRVLEEGYQHLNGQQVLDYCRARKKITGANSAGANSDIGRADRQQRMLFTIFRELQKKDQLVHIPKVYDAVRDYVHTDMRLEQIAALALFGRGIDPEAGLRRHTLQGEMISDTPYSGASYYVLDMDALHALMETVFGADIQTDYCYDYRYVRADKASATGRAYMAAAVYLCGPLGLDAAALESYDPAQLGAYGYYYPADLLPLYEAYAQAERLCVRDTRPREPVYDRAILAQAEADYASMDAAAQALRDQLYTLCLSRGLTRAQVDKKQLPSELYKALPVQ